MSIFQWSELITFQNHYPMENMKVCNDFMSLQKDEWSLFLLLFHDDGTFHASNQHTHREAITTTCRFMITVMCISLMLSSVWRIDVRCWMGSSRMPPTSAGSRPEVDASGAPEQIENTWQISMVQHASIHCWRKYQKLTTFFFAVLYPFLSYQALSWQVIRIPSPNLLISSTTPRKNRLAIN